MFLAHPAFSTNSSTENKLAASGVLAAFRNNEINDGSHAELVKSAQRRRRRRRRLARATWSWTDDDMNELYKTNGCRLRRGWQRRTEVRLATAHALCSSGRRDTNAAASDRLTDRPPPAMWLRRRLPLTFSPFASIHLHRCFAANRSFGVEEPTLTVSTVLS